MKTNSLGPVGQVSRLTLGGGGIGLVWGESTRDEAIATIHAALDGGINLLDTAPMYGAWSESGRKAAETARRALTTGISAG